MEKQVLLNSVSKLKPVSQESANEYANKTNIFINRMNEVMTARSDIDKLVGAENLEMMKDNHANHARFIASILRVFDSEVFVETVLWVFSAYMNHGFSSNYWAAQLNCWINILSDELTESAYQEIYPYYEWMQTNIPVFVEISESV